MIPFIICIEEIEIDEIEDDIFVTGRELHKDYTWPLVPPKGDSVGVGGNQYKVFEVVHNFDVNPATINVILRCTEFDFKMLSEDTSWKRVFWRE